MGMNVASARAELLRMKQDEERPGQDRGNEDDEEENSINSNNADAEARRDELKQIIINGGRDPSKEAWEGPKARIYFPDAGNAALASRDWNPTGPPDEALV